MAHVFIADTTDGVANLTRILGPHHDLTAALTARAARTALESATFDLIIVGVHFEESRAFELFPVIKAIPANAGKPVICFCTRDTQITRLMHRGLQLTSEALGAWMYLDQHAYNVLQDPDAELKRVIERCLAAEARKRTSAERKGIHAKRSEIQRLRADLMRETWSNDVENRLGRLRLELARALRKLSRSLVENVLQQRVISSSRELYDRVSPGVKRSEDGMAVRERGQVLAEADQSADEQGLGEAEDLEAQRRAAVAGGVG